MDAYVQSVCSYQAKTHKFEIRDACTSKLIDQSQSTFLAPKLIISCTVLLNYVLHKLDYTIIFLYMYLSGACIVTSLTLEHTNSFNSSAESTASFLAKSARLLIAPMLANASSRN